MSSARMVLRRMFDAAINVAQPEHCLPPHLPPAPKGRMIVVGAGKASAAMAKAFEDHWPGPVSGVVVTRYGYAVPCERIEIVEAAHPVPDAAGLTAAKRILALASGLTADDLVVCLISGGGSALLSLPADGLTLDDKQNVNRALLKSGATIGEINCVRRHLSAIKGGRLAAACHPAQVVTLLMSDVPGDDPINIASGPTVADPTTCADALDVIRRYGVDVAPAVMGLLESGAGETVKPGDPRLAKAETRMIATPQASLEAAAAVAREAGYAAAILGDAIEGEARDVGKVMAGIAHQVALHAQPVAPPGRAAVGRRDDGHRARQRSRRTQCRIPAVTRNCARRSTRDLCARRGYRRRRWPGGDRRRHRHARHAGAGVDERHPTARVAREQRWPRLFRSPRRLRRHRADAHQRKRLPRDSRATAWTFVVRGCYPMNAFDRITAASDRLVHAHRMHAPFDAPAEAAPASVDEAYAIQDDVARRLWTRHGTPIRAWKTGGPNAHATPIAAPIPASRVFASDASLNGADYHIIGIEAELAYALERDLPPRAAPYVDADVVDSIRSMHVAIEVCDSRLVNFRTANALWKLADNQSNGGLVVGNPIHDWRRIVPDQLSAFVEVDGTPLAQATGSHPYGDPLRLLPWLANHCAARCGGLRAGDVITTGAWTGMHIVESHAQVVARFSKLGEVRVAFEA